jgi:hypothetical protein
MQMLLSGPVGGVTTSDLEDLRSSVKNASDFEDLGNIN